MTGSTLAVIWQLVFCTTWGLVILLWILRVLLNVSLWTCRPCCDSLTYFRLQRQLWLPHLFQATETVVTSSLISGYRDSCDFRSHRCYERRTYVGVHATKAGLDASVSLLHFANDWVKQPGKKKTQTVYSNQKKKSDKKKGDTLGKKKANKKNGGTSGDQTTEGYNPETSWMYG